MKVCRSFKSARQDKNNIGLPINDVSLDSYADTSEDQFSLPADSIDVDRLPLEFLGEPQCHFTESSVWKYPKGKSGARMRMELLKPLNPFFQRFRNLGLVPDT